LANALWSLFGDEAPLQEGHDSYENTFQSQYQSMMAAKLGLSPMEWIMRCVGEAYYDTTAVAGRVADEVHAWMMRYVRRLLLEPRDDIERLAQMNRVNPLYVLRNYLAQQAINAAEEGDYREIERLLWVLRKPHSQRAGMES